MTFSSSFTNNVQLTGYLHPSDNSGERERSLHHIIQQAGEAANLPFPTHPYMLRWTGLYYRAALLLQPLGLTLRQCCLLWNWHGTTAEFSPQEEQDYRAIDRTTKAAFKAALEKLKALKQIAVYQNVIDYLLGAFLLFPRLQGIPQDYWLAPRSWHI